MDEKHLIDYQESASVDIRYNTSKDMPWEVQLYIRVDTVATAEGKTLSQALYNLASWIQVNVEG